MSAMWFYLLIQRLGKAAEMPFAIHPHMLRHPCGFKLANDGHETRALQHYLGHKNIQHRRALPTYPLIDSGISGEIERGSYSGSSHNASTSTTISPTPIQPSSGSARSLRIHDKCPEKAARPVATNGG